MIRLIKNICLVSIMCSLCALNACSLVLERSSVNHKSMNFETQSLAAPSGLTGLGNFSQTSSSGGCTTCAH